MAAPAPEGSPPKSARASIRHHLRELQVAYESLQEQQAQVAAQAILSPARRRATDPGSPALPPRCAVRSLPNSPLPPHLPANAPGSPGLPPDPRPARSPTRAPLTADRLQQRRRQRSHSAAATPVTDAAQLHERLAAAAGAEQPIDSYHRYAAQLFERRFCPLRTGLAEQQPSGAASSALEQQQGLQAQAGGELGEQQAGVQQRQQQEAGVPLSRKQQEAGVPWSRQQQQQQQRQPQAAPATPADQRKAAADAPPASASCSSGSSFHSFASEEGDVVQVASPERGELGAAAAPAGDAAGPAAVSARPASAQRGGGAAPQLAASPLPLLSAALQLLTSPAGQPCSPVGIQPLRLAFDQAARASAEAGVQQQQVQNFAQLAQQAVQPAADPAEPAVGAAAMPAASRAACSAADDAGQDTEEHPASAGTGGSSREAVAEVSDAALPPALQPAAAPGPAAGEAAAAGGRPCSAGGRAQALQRLKQRRLLQRGDSALAAPGLRSSCGEGLPLQLEQLEQPAEETAADRLANQAEQRGRQAAEQAANETAKQAATPPPPQQQQESRLQQQDSQQQQAAEQHESPGSSASQDEQRQAQQPHRQRQEQQQQGYQHPEQQEQQQGDLHGGNGDDGAERKPPRPFLRRRSQMVPMQKLPDWKAVRPKTSTRWEGGASGASTPGAGTPGGIPPKGSTPTASRPGTPTAGRLASLPAARAAPPATAPPLSVQRAAHREHARPATASRAARGGVAWPRETDWSGSSSGEPATYLLSPPVGPPAAGRGARAAGGGQAQQAQQAQQARQQRRQSVGTGSMREDAPWGGGGKQPKRGGGSSGSGSGSARTTPFAPRPNSGESRQPWGQARRQQQQRPRGTPIYDASTLLPLSMEGLLLGSSGGAGQLVGSSGTGFPDLLAAGSLTSGPHPLRAGSHRLARSGGAAANPTLLLPPGAPHAGQAEAAAEAVDGGPLDDLLCAVDRMLHQVERALD